MTDEAATERGAVLGEDEVLATGESIARVQEPSGAIPWPDGHVDAWDHVECAMALSACGLRGPARRAYRWLRDIQRADGSWPRSSVAGAVVDPAAESHHAAYVAVGVWHEYLVTGDENYVLTLWPTVRRAVEWALGLRTPRGEVRWERVATGAPGEYALLSGCSNIHQSLRCAVALAKLADDPQPDWELAADRLAYLVAAHPDSSAYVPGMPATSLSQSTSPRGARSPSAHSTARRTVGHMASACRSSPVTRYSCQAPTATYAAWWLSAAGSVTRPASTDRGQDPSARWASRSHR